MPNSIAFLSSFQILPVTQHPVDEKRVPFRDGVSIATVPLRVYESRNGRNEGLVPSEEGNLRMISPLHPTGIRKT